MKVVKWMTSKGTPVNTDAYHIATAAYYGMDVLLTWNCKHMANEFTLPKTYGVLRDAGLKCPVIITPKRYMEDEHGIHNANG